MVGKVDYDDRQFAVYARGRALTPAVLARWMKVFAGHAPPRRPLAVLDLGSGTGRFTAALAGTFGGPVYGVEPSPRMREVAIRSSAHPAVTYLVGCARVSPAAWPKARRGCVCALSQRLSTSPSRKPHRASPRSMPPCSPGPRYSP